MVSESESESSLLKLATEIGSPSIQNATATWHLGPAGLEPVKNYLAVVDYFDKKYIYQVGFLIRNRDQLPRKISNGRERGVLSVNLKWLWSNANKKKPDYNVKTASPLLLQPLRN